jgi:NitT/TauT family transport system ATP-binding protein
MSVNVVPIFPSGQAPAEPGKAAEPARPVRPLLRLDRVSKTFANATIALENVDLAIRPGELVSLLGPSGCGKSTLLKLVAGLGQPTGGTIDWPQATYDAQGEPDRLIGYVFQEPTLLPWRTVQENVRLPLMLAGVGRREAEARIADALAQVGLVGFAGAYPRQLSGGMKMRVSIARALVTRPRVLLMDEPFAALDEITRFKLNNNLLELFVRQNLTVIFVTHSVYESVFLSSRIVVMTTRPGRVSADIAIDLPYPRDEDIRMAQRYNGYCRVVSEALRRAMAEGTMDAD